MVRSLWLARTVGSSFVCNGEIYNHRALRRELERRGHRFATDSDAEVVVHAFEEEGEAALGRLQGMFALALWDEASSRLLLARDPAGMKPLFYLRWEDRWWFAPRPRRCCSRLPLHDGPICARSTACCGWDSCPVRVPCSRRCSVSPPVTGW